MLTSTTPITMPNSELTTEPSLQDLPPGITPVLSEGSPFNPLYFQNSSHNCGAGWAKNVKEETETGLNPLFHPETLEQLTHALLAEIQGPDLGPELAEVVSTAKDQTVLSLSTSPLTSLPASPSLPSPTPSFYFLEDVTQATTEVTQPVTEIPQSFAYSAPIDPYFAPHVQDQGFGFFDVHSIRRDFPILQERVNGKPLVWFDNAATTQKPQSVIDRLAYFYRHENSNVHRAAHELAARSTDAYEAARETIRRFLNAASVNEIIFVRGTTEGINLVAKSWGLQNLQAGDEIVLTHLEHHANIVPWQQLAQQTGAKLRVAPVDDRGQILLAEYQQLLNPRTKLVAFSQVSNALGTITPAKEIIDLAHRVGAKVLLDAAQSVAHIPIDVQALNPDWLVFSGHKIFGPTGIGAVYGKEDLLNATQPWQGGGNMILDVTFERTIYHETPTRFEAGTGNIADAVGLGTALDYVQKVGLPRIAAYEHELLVYATEGLQTISGLRLIGTASDKAAVLSFVLEGFEVTAIGQYLNQQGIAVRAGHHCAQPILRRFGLEATVRASLAFYNTKAEVDALILALEGIRYQTFG